MFNIHSNRLHAWLPIWCQYFVNGDMMTKEDKIMTSFKCVGGIIMKRFPVYTFKRKKRVYGVVYERGGPVKSKQGILWIGN